MNRRLLYGGGILLTTAALSIVLDKVFEYYQFDALPYLYLCPIQTAFRFFPALFFFVAGYIGALAASRLPTERFGTKQRALLAILCAVLYFIFESSSDHTINMFRFYYGGSMAAALPIALLGAGAVIFAVQLLPRDLTFLQKVGRESMHIMILHGGAIRMNKIIAALWTALVPSRVLYIGFIASVINLLLAYACAVYLLEPLCRLAKARFDAIIR